MSDAHWKRRTSSATHRLRATAPRVGDAGARHASATGRRAERTQRQRRRDDADEASALSESFKVARRAVEAACLERSTEKELDALLEAEADDDDA